LGVLSQFTVDERALSLTDLSRKTGLHRATVYRFAKTLESDGYLAYDGENAVYTIGQSWAAGLYSLGRGSVLGEVLNHDLRALAEAMGETTALSVRKGQVLQVINAAPASHFFTPRLPESALVSLSESWSVHVRLHLAFSTEDDWERVAEVYRRGQGEEDASAQTAAIRERILRAATDGIAYSREDYREGICAMAVPVFRSGRLFATLGLVVPVERFHGANVERYSQDLRAAAAEMGRRLDEEREQMVISWPERDRPEPSKATTRGNNDKAGR
jgi:DNA-binding IclR family transcriptional regulator